MAENLKSENKENSFEETKARLAQKLEQMERDRLDREKADVTRRKLREEFHQRLMERRRVKSALFRSIAESQAAIAKIRSQPNA